MSRSCPRGVVYWLCTYSLSDMAMTPKVVSPKDRRPLLATSWSPKLFQGSFWGISSKSIMGIKTDRKMQNPHWALLKTVSRTFQKHEKTNENNMRNERFWEGKAHSFFNLGKGGRGWVPMVFEALEFLKFFMISMFSFLLRFRSFWDFWCFRGFEFLAVFEIFLSRRGR